MRTTEAGVRSLGNILGNIARRHLLRSRHLPTPAAMNSASAPTRDAVRFGTFAGVFTPNVLTILGVIMFLRFGQIVGQAEHLSRLLENARIDADVEVIVSDDIVAEMRKRSRKAAVVFMGFDPPSLGSAEVFAANYYRVMEHLDTVILVHGAGDVDLEA